MKKAIATKDIKLPQGEAKTDTWDPSKMITTGNIEKVRAANAKDKKGKK